MQPVILTVLRSGGEYRAEHVERIKEQCNEFAPGIEFRCVSDGAVPGIAVSPLLHDWPGWWAKMELFRFRGPCLYMDLDTTIAADLAPLLDVAMRYDFVAVRDFNPTVRRMGSGVMAWRGDRSDLYRRFAEAPERHIAENMTDRHWGDQGFIDRHVEPEFWQDLLPGAVVSWKKDCGSGIPEGARVVAFHGYPRPWDVGQ